MSQLLDASIMHSSVFEYSTTSTRCAASVDAAPWRTSPSHPSVSIDSMWTRGICALEMKSSRVRARRAIALLPRARATRARGLNEQR